MSSPKKILYVCYGGGHVNMIVPVYKEIARDPNYQQLVLGLTTAKTTLEKEGISFISFRNLLDKNEKARAYGMELFSPNSAHPDVPEDESIAYLGLSFFDLVSEVGEAKAHELYQQKARGAFLPKHTLKSLINSYSPDLVIATNAPRAEKAALLAAKELGTKSLCLVDIFSLNALQGDLSQPGYGTWICVLNDYAKTQLIASGRPENEIRVTGNPAFDRLLDPKFKAQALAYKNKNHLTGKKIFLWTRSTLPEDSKLADDVENKLIELALQNPNYALILRPHPNEPKRQFPPSDNIVYSDRFDDLAVVLHASDIVCTLYSTVGIEAALIGKKVIQMTSTNLFKSLDFVKAGIAAGAGSLADLEEIIHDFKAQTADEMTASIATNSTNNVVAAIHSLTSG